MIAKRSALIVMGVLATAAASRQEFAFEPYQADLAAGATLSNASADFDGDGDLDLFVGFNGAPNRLFRNDKGNLKDVAADVGMADGRATRAAAWGDFDADGDPDLLVGFAAGAGPVLRLYRNHQARFEDVTARSGLTVGTGAVRQPAWIDFDGDDDLDLFVAFRDRVNALYRNDAGAFIEIASSLGLA
ncbi:MAG: VCBS repeat-containing protein, partial [Acidobacteria bacterium]|nr:VCBS repeat-containing protein [Acidobacteriota bacterium]